MVKWGMNSLSMQSDLKCACFFFPFPNLIAKKRDKLRSRGKESHSNIDIHHILSKFSIIDSLKCMLFFFHIYNICSINIMLRIFTIFTLLFNPLPIFGRIELVNIQFKMCKLIYKYLNVVRSP